MSAPIDSASTRLWKRDEATIAGVEKLRFFPLAVESGSGVYLTEPGGRQLMDFSATWTASGLGHGNEKVAEAVAQAVHTGAGASILSATHEPGVALAEALLELVPARKQQSTREPSHRSGIRENVNERRVYLGHAGTDANDVALRGCRYATGRKEIIAFTNGYHGGVGIAHGVSGIHIAAGANADPGAVIFPYAAASGGDRLLREVTDAVRAQMQAGQVAAVIVEPIQSDGGIIVPHPDFLLHLRNLCDEFSIYLIVDEVKVGLGRTGQTFAFEHFGIVPDVVTLGKTLGAGLPLSAAVAPKVVLDQPVASALMTTIGNPVSCAAGMAMLHELVHGGLLNNVSHSGHRLVELLSNYRNSGRAGARLISEVRGHGLVQGVQFVARGVGLHDAADVAAKVAYRAWQLGVVAYPVGDGVVEITPPLTISIDEIEDGTELLCRAIDDVAAGEVSDADIAPYAGW